MNNQQFPSTPSLVPSPLTSSPAIVSLPKASQLLKEALKIYKSRFWVFAGLIIVPIILSLLIDYIVYLKVWWRGIVIIIYFFVYLWVSVSCVYAIKERNQKIGIKESLAKGWNKLISWLWISILNIVIVGLGLLLFIIPGIIFAIWFVFSGYILVSEDLRGMEALSRSRQLVKGNWWKIFWRFLIAFFVIFIALFLIGLPFGLFCVWIFNIPDMAEEIGSIIGGILGIFATPFGFTFGFLIYENLKGIKRD